MRLLRVYMLLGFLVLGGGLTAQIDSAVKDSSSFVLDSLQLQKLKLKPDFIPQKGSYKIDAPSTFLNKNVDSSLIRKKVASDSLTKKKVTNSLFAKPTGTISAGYDYGVIPFAAILNVPTGYFKTEGNASVEVKKLPFNVSYFYSTLKYVAGLNNYFRISFDAPKYRENLEKEKAQVLGSYKDKLTDYERLRMEKMQKLYFLQNVASSGDFKSLTKNKLDYYQNQLTGVQPVIDTSIISDAATLIEDSLKGIQNGIVGAGAPNLPVNTDSIKELYSDSLAYYQNLLSYCDSATYYTNQIQNDIEDVNKKIDETRSTINSIENTGVGDVGKNYMPSRFKNIARDIKRFEIGMCYPNHSTFLVNGVALKGINTEYERKKFYFAFTAGKTVNNLLFTNNSIQNSLQNVRNLYNYFDFNNVVKGRNIVALKTGFGKKEETHIYVGFMHGIGYSSYLVDSTLTDVVGNDKERNWTMELDARYAYKKVFTFDVVYGKSSLFNVNEVMTEQEKRAEWLFNFKYRSNAIQGKSVFKIEKLKSQFSAAVRVVDPYFTSFGVYFIRKDNIRYEFKYDQQIGKKIKLALSYRKDQNNLLNLFAYYNTIQTIGSSITYKVNKRLTLRAMYNPVIQRITDKKEYLQINTNNISNFIVTYTPRAKNVSTSFNAIYSYYYLTLPAAVNQFQNASVNFNLQTKKELRNNFAASWFKSNLIDSVNNNTILISDEFSVLIKKKVIVGVGGKLSLNETMAPQIGYSVKINAPIYKKLYFELSAERLVIGDFYNSFNYTQINKFPYYGYSKLIWSF